jgi:hypothetical protein
VPIAKFAAVVLLGLAVACGGDPGVGDNDASTHGLSPAFMKAVRAYREFDAEMLAKAMTQDRLDLFSSGTERRINDMKVLVKTDADRNVLLLLALMRANDRERFILVLKNRAGGDAAAERDIPVLYEARQTCQDELLEWIDATDTTSLDEGECLAEAKEAADELGLSAASQH